MNEKRESTCGNCAFFQPHEWDEAVGTCRRAPPQTEGFPAVDTDDWCGEWDDRATATGTVTRRRGAASGIRCARSAPARGTCEQTPKALSCSV